MLTQGRSLAGSEPSVHVTSGKRATHTSASLWRFFPASTIRAASLAKLHGLTVLVDPAHLACSGIFLLRDDCAKARIPLV